MAEGTLFERIGGEEGISKLIDVFYYRVMSDPELSPFFAHTEESKLRAMQKEFFSEALGGPLFYSGRSMREVHQGRGIKKSHLSRFTDHLMSVLKDHQDELAMTNQDVDAVYSRIALGPMRFPEAEVRQASVASCPVIFYRAPSLWLGAFDFGDGS